MVGPEKEDTSSSQDLLEVLVNKSAISKAQATLVKQDHQSTGMSIDEILVARGWVTEKQLSELAPWLSNNQNEVADRAGKSSYEENLKNYRRVMAEILGESSE